MDDVEAIKQLKARYFRMMDTKDWALATPNVREGLGNLPMRVKLRMR